MLSGQVDHGDSLGNSGTLGSGDVQWMTAGSGILHQEMPRGDDRGRMHGFQLWANLPASMKMTAPRYQDVAGRDIPEAVEDDGTRVRVVCGSFWGKKGPVEGIAADPSTSNSGFPRGMLHAPRGNHPSRVRLHFRGLGDVPRCVGTAGSPNRRRRTSGVHAVRRGGQSVGLVLFDRGDEVVVQAGEHGIRFLLVSGKPLKEPVAWYARSS